MNGSLPICHTPTPRDRNPSGSAAGRRLRGRRRGATLIDVAMGSMLLAIVLIPSVRLLRTTESLHRRTALREAMLFEAERLIEEQKIWLTESANFNAAHAAPGGIIREGDVAIPDGPPLRTLAMIQRDSSVAPAQLLTIDVTVFQDVNGNRRVDSDEPFESLRTQRAAP